MSYFARLRGRDSRRRPAPARYVLEALEGRTMLSATASSVAASHERITSETVLQSSLTTAVTGARVTFNATVEDTRNDAPIASGTVNFTIESPQKIVLGNVNVNKQGAASIATKDLTKIGQYQIKAQYTPSNPKISASAAAPVTVKVIPIPLNVPTVTTLASAASTAEVGQYVPLVATVADAGTGTQVDAGRVEPIKGTVEFFTDSPTPIILGDVPLSGTDKASLPTNLLKNAGPYQIEAEFLPSNFFFTGSVSAPTTVTISPATHNSPTVTTLETPTTTFETGESIPLNMTVQNAYSGLANGVVQIVSVSRHPVVLATIDVSTIGRPISIVTNKLQEVGQYRIEAEFSPTGNRFAASISAPVTVTVTPLTAASFAVTPTVHRGHLNEPLSVTVTALNAENRPRTNYTGTIAFSSPTDSWTIFPASVYASLDITPPPPQSTGLATFAIQSYTFTPADHGTHTFVGEVNYGKGGAETLKATQANDPKVFGTTTFAIG
jgi:hypothetical protein